MPSFVWCNLTKHIIVALLYVNSILNSFFYRCESLGLIITNFIFLVSATSASHRASITMYDTLFERTKLRQINDRAPTRF